MDDALRVVVEMNQSMWGRLKRSLEDLSEDEVEWRPLPQANNINVIVRHLRIEAEWHLASLEHGELMPTIATTPSQDAIDAVPMDFEANFRKLEELYARFLELLAASTLVSLKQRTAAAYGKASEVEGRTYMLAYHQAMHLAAHCGQIQNIRNLYRKTRGQPARFFPENPTYPKQP
jgi:hypothetical protein